MEFTIRIGNENEFDQLKDMSVVTATYHRRQGIWAPSALSVRHVWITARWYR